MGACINGEHARVEHQVSLPLAASPKNEDSAKKMGKKGGEKMDMALSELNHDEILH